MIRELADVSVVIPAFRAADTIERALSSVAVQTIRPREIIVVDDGSDDGTAEIAESMAPSLGMTNLFVHRQANLGPGAARNRGVAAATQPIIAFLDADDEWLPEKLERSLERMRDGNRVLVAHNSWIVDGGKITLNDCARRFRETADPFVSLYRKGYIDTCTVLARRDAILAAGGFDETLPNAQDFELWLALSRLPSTDVFVFDEPLCRYYIRPGSVMSRTARRLVCCLEIAERYFRCLFRPTRPRTALAAMRDLWFRIAAVHAEAISAYRARGELLSAITCLAMFPFRVGAVTLRAWTAGSLSRPRYLGAPERLEEKVSASRIPLSSPLGRHSVRFIWGWVGIVLIAYLYQFHTLVRPILAIIGI